jgi:hypothetical protein
MAKSTVKIKHLGIWSTAKFAAVFCFLFSTLFLLLWGAMFGVMVLLMTAIGAMGGKDSLIASIIGGGLSFGMFLVAAVGFVILYTIVGFTAGIIGAFVFNLVAKFSGGLSYDAEIN